MVIFLTWNQTSTVNLQSVQNNCYLFWYLLLSYADGKCSGRPECLIDVMLLIKHSKPCPLELSSYFEASFNCINGKDVFIWKLCRSGICSGRIFCEIEVHELFKITHPCPLESSRIVIFLRRQFCPPTWFFFECLNLIKDSVNLQSCVNFKIFLLF